MKKLSVLSIIGLLTTTLFGCATNTNSGTSNTTKIERKHYQSWESDIGYSQVVRSGNTLYISGLTSSGITMNEQVDGIYGQLKSILIDYNATIDQVVREVVFTKDIESLKQAIQTRKKHFNNGHYPSSSWIEVSRLYEDQLLIEIEFTVVL